MKPRKGSCIIWPGCTTGRYGLVNLTRKRRLPAHRVIYEGVYGKVDKALVIDHICRNKLCVNIKHLRAITNAENVLCGIGITAQNKRKVVCKRGHPLKPRPCRPEWRECVTCKYKKSRESLMRIRARKTIRQTPTKEGGMSDYCDCSGSCYWNGTCLECKKKRKP